MLSVNGISKSFGAEIILKEISFSLNRGERLGLIGPNGCGKTTLLRIISGKEAADSGSFRYNPTHLRIGFLEQGINQNSDKTVEGFLSQTNDNIDLLSSRIQLLADELARSPGGIDLQRAYDEALGRLGLLLEQQKHQTEVMGQMKLDAFPHSTPLSHLSGGQKTRLALARILLSSPELLLLDEPTNHLDITMLEWLESWLTRSSMARNCAILVVSHDRVFLDQIVTGILEIDPHDHKLRAYPGNYSSYLEQKLGETERRWQAYSDQQEEIGRLRRAAMIERGQAVFKKGGKSDTADKFARGFFANRSRKNLSRSKNIERKLNKLLDKEHIDKPSQDWQMKLDFSQVAESSRQVFLAENLTIGYSNTPLLEDVNLSLRFGGRAALIGPNGVGKTTLLRTIAGQNPVLSGTIRIGKSVVLGYMAQEQEPFDPDLNSYETIRALTPLSETDARAFLHQYLFTGEDVFIPAGLLSYGERARLCLACLVAQGCNLLLLDEPINHLDIPSRSRFEKALSVFPGTVIAVVHDRYFIAGFATVLWKVQGRTIQVLDLD